VCCAAHRTCGERCKTEDFRPSDADVRRHLDVIAVRGPAAPAESA
jgi:hypothetical protein